MRSLQDGAEDGIRENEARSCSPVGAECGVQFCRTTFIAVFPTLDRSAGVVKRRMRRCSTLGRTFSAKTLFGRRRPGSGNARRPQHGGMTRPSCRARRRRVLKSRTRAPSERVPKHQALQAAERRFLCFRAAIPTRGRRGREAGAKFRHVLCLSPFFRRKVGEGNACKVGILYLYSAVSKSNHAAEEPQCRPLRPFPGTGVRFSGFLEGSCRKLSAGVRRMRHPAAVTFRRTSYNKGKRT